MPKKIVFHVGLMKTGTTAIQLYLRRHDEQLRSLGILYPGPREQEADPERHPLMYNAMMGREVVPSPGFGAQACRDAVARTFRQFRRSNLDTLIWSHEGMALSARNWDIEYLSRVLRGDEVRIVCFVRYTDDWVESVYKENIWARAGPRADALQANPLRRPGAAPPKSDDSKADAVSSMVHQGSKVIKALGVIRQALPSADIVVRSYDANRANGTVVSGALAAMGVPVDAAFPDADDEAGVKNPTKSGLYSMLLYHLVTGQADVDVLRAVAQAARGRERRGREFKPLMGRCFRFLSDEDVALARGYYEELRLEYPNLPAQGPNLSNRAERHLAKDDGVALLDWLRPDISDTIFDRARAAYPTNRKRPAARTRAAGAPRRSGQAPHTR